MHDGGKMSFFFRSFSEAKMRENDVVTRMKSFNVGGFLIRVLLVRRGNCEDERKSPNFRKTRGRDGTLITDGM